MTTPDQRLRDVGSAGIETVFAVTGLLLVLFFVVGGMRVVNSNGDVSAAARAGARAAATARTSGQANSDAVAVVTNMLAGRGVACTGRTRRERERRRCAGQRRHGDGHLQRVAERRRDRRLSWQPQRDRQRSRIRRHSEGRRMSEAHDTDDNAPESRDRGETMLMTVVLITFLLLGSWTLISASQQWGARRDVQAVSSAAARAGAQVSEVEVRGGSVTIDPARRHHERRRCCQRRDTRAVSVNGLTVTVIATGSVDYRVPGARVPGRSQRHRLRRPYAASR